MTTDMIPTWLLWADDAVDQIDNGEYADAITLLGMLRDSLRETMEDDA